MEAEPTERDRQKVALPIRILNFGSDREVAVFTNEDGGVEVVRCDFSLKPRSIPRPTGRADV